MVYHQGHTELMVHHKVEEMVVYHRGGLPKEMYPRQSKIKKSILANILFYRNIKIEIRSKYNT